MSTQKLSDRDRQLARMWLAGKTLEFIAAEFGLKSHSTLVRRAKQIGLPSKRDIARGVAASPELLAAIGAKRQASRETKEQYRARVREIADRIVRQRGAEVLAAAARAQAAQEPTGDKRAA